jgi:hypothetical protein
MSAVRTLHRRRWVPRPLETVFDFFALPFLRRNEAAIRVDRPGVAGP